MIERLLRRVLRHREIENDGDVYLRRFYLGPSVFGLQFMLHHILRADKAQEMHDHPWWFASLCLRGGFYEETDAGIGFHLPGEVKVRPAEFRHRIGGIFPPCWTLVLAGPRSRRWGWWTKERGFVYWRDYLGISKDFDPVASARRSA